MLVGMLPAMASADEVGEDLAPPAPQEENYGYVRLVFAEGEQLDLCHGEYITECSPTAEIFSGADEDFIANGEYAALYYEGKLYCKAALDGVSINADAVLPAEAFALVPMGEKSALAAKPENESSGSDETVGTPPSTEPAPLPEPESKEEDKTTEDEGDPSGSNYDIGDDTQPRGLMRMLVMPTAAGNYPAASSVFVDGDKQFYDGRLYYRNGDKSKQFSGNENDYNAHYDPTKGTLTLKNYNGKGISVGGVKSTNITVKLIGTNIINDGSLTNGVGGDIIITSESGGTLSISKTTSGSNPAIGIETGFSASDRTGNVRIEGSAKVTINMTHNGTSTYERAYGIYAKENITISGDASVDITCATPSNTRGGDRCNGLYADKNVTIATNGTIKIDVTKAGKDDGYSYGVYPMGTATLTKVGNMEVNWKKDAHNSNYSGGAFFRGGSFNASTHAVNEDTTNCYASYRKGTPYQVTAGNGKLTGPGVKYPNGSGMFLKGDTVNITPNVKTGKSGEVIPFQKWTSDDVTFDKSAATASNSFTVPAKKVTVTAMHSPFIGTPTFTPTGDLNDRGVLTFETLVRDYDGSEYFNLVKVGDEGTYISFNPNTTSTSPPYVYTYKASSGFGASYVAPGEYYVAEKLDNWWYLSEKFTVNYVKPRPKISTNWWFDPTVFTSVEEGYAYATGLFLTIDNKGTADTGPLTITVEGANPTAFTVSTDSISNIAAGGKAEPIVRPAKGLAAGEYYATLKISGANVDTLSLNMKFTVTPKMTAIARPTANTGLVYNGTEQIGVNAGAGYTLGGTYKATNVGTADYTATATLNSNYKWSDGGTDLVTITWNIGKRNPQSTDIVVTPPGKLVYDGNRKDATAKLDSKYTGAGAIKISKYVNPDTGEEVQPINAGTYTVYVNVAGGSNFNAATNLNRPGLWNFTIEKASQNAPVGLSASAPTSSSGKGKINGTMANMQYTKTPDVPISWSDCTEGSTVVDPGTYYVRYKGDNNHDASPYVKVTVPEHGAGVTVSGTAVSWNNTNDALYYLYPSTTEDTVIRAQWKTGGTVSGYYTEYTVTKEAISSTTVDGKTMKAQTFSFGTIPAGSYKLVIFKPDKYVPKIVPITVGTTDYDCGQLKLWLYGDVNYDGVVNKLGDILNLNRYSAGLSSVFDTGDVQTKKDRFDAANVTAITGTDTIINKTGDILNIGRYIAGYSSVLDKAK